MNNEVPRRHLSRDDSEFVSMGFDTEVVLLTINKNFESDWFVYQRLQEVKSAHRVNLIRVVAVLAFFSIILYRHFSSDAIPTDYLWSSIRICGVWMLVAVAVFVALSVKILPPITKYIATSCDVLLVTAVASIGDRAESNLIVGYFLVIAASYLRHSLPFIIFTTLSAIFGYLCLVYTTSQYWARPPGMSFPWVDIWRIVAGLVVMAFIGWQLCLGSKEGLKLSIESNLAEERK